MVHEISRKNAATQHQDDVINWVLDAFRELGYEQIEFVKHCANEEIEATKNLETLFRSNTIEVKVLTVFSKRIGSKYLMETLENVLTQIILKNAEMEIFENKIADRAKMDVNRKNVEAAFQQIFDAIMQSSKKVPWEIRLIQHLVWEGVQAKFPDSATKIHCTGCFYFLRFLCPALVIPEKANIVGVAPSANLQRGLLFITKILQSMANNVLFGSKEPQMICFNEIIERNRTRFNQFLQEISQLVDYTPEKFEPKKMSDNVYDKLRGEFIAVIDKLEPLLYCI
uniref:Ras-GAP domain-containing protein n=1 Tax=Arcella intermedia TaxID=1963864 RepID=A0A6B2LDI3_9EUKA